MYKICVYAICKNEQQYVDRWMNVVSEADLVGCARIFERFIMNEKK